MTLRSSPPGGTRTTLCACGCGDPVLQSNRDGKGGTRAVTRRYIHGHNRRGAVVMPAEVRAAITVLRAAEPEPGKAWARFDEYQHRLAVGDAAIAFVAAFDVFVAVGGVLRLVAPAIMDMPEAKRANDALNTLLATSRNAQGVSHG